MAKKTGRLNDTAAVASMPAMQGDYEGERYTSHTSRTRKIDNGYITSETHHGNGDSFKSTERFHETASPPSSDSKSLAGDQSNAMSRAKAFLNK